MLRDKYNTLQSINKNKCWTPILRIKRQFPVGRYQSALVMRPQLPVRFSAGKTCHQCQGVLGRHTAFHNFNIFSETKLTPKDDSEDINLLVVQNIHVHV